ncbi:MAG: hypothetical protein LBU76_01480 [Azoarcus sp.]|jgi:hypothetical protein|nr:hypothetical protein [Azoarcus sp.]
MSRNKWNPPQICPEPSSGGKNFLPLLWVNRPSKPADMPFRPQAQKAKKRPNWTAARQEGSIGNDSAYFKNPAF